MTDVTVVIPAWNMANLVRVAAQSVGQQSVRAALIVVDNASEVSLPYDQVDADWVTLPNRQSLGEARNIGLAHVKTEYVLFLDADDVLLPCALHHLITAMATDRSLVLASLAFIGWDGHRSAVSPWGFPPTIAYRLQHKPHIAAACNVVKSILPAVGSTLLRTDDVIRAGGFSNANRGEDWALSAVLGFMGNYRLMRTPGLLLRVRADSLSVAGEHWTPIWDSRCEVRRRVRSSSYVPAWGRALAATSAPLHVLTAARRLRHQHGASLLARDS